MLALVTWALLCLGPTVALTQASILEPLRASLGSVWAPLGELSRCALCTGFWVGVVWALLCPHLGPAAALPWASSLARVAAGTLLNALCSASVCWIVVMAVSK